MGGAPTRISEGRRVLKAPSGRRLLGRAFAEGALVVVLVVETARLLWILAGHVRRIADWDFMAFWVWGRVAAAGQNVYDPQSYTRFMPLFGANPDFVRETLEVGLIYPPPSILLFLPLGWFSSPQAALVCWYAMQLTALGISIALLADRFLADARQWRYPLVAALVLALPATYETIALGQTNFLALLAAVQVLRNRSHPITQGVWLGLAIAVKPLLAVLGLLALLQFRWRTLVASIATLILLTVAVIPVVGFGTLMTFVRANPVARAAPWVFSETTNQSLSAIVFRLRGAWSMGTVAGDPLYITLAVLLLAVTVVLVLRASAAEADVAFSLILSLGLILYPASLWHYAVLLIIPSLVVWHRRASLPATGAAAAALIVVLYALAIASHQRATGVAYLFSWLLSAGLLVWPTKGAPVGAPGVSRVPGAKDVRPLTHPR